MALQAPQMPPALFSLVAAAGLALTQLPLLRPALMRIAFARVQASESGIGPMDLRDWHTYEILWHRDQIKFIVDASTVMHTDIPIQLPLGFVVWIDNQYAQATPEKGLRFGTIPTEESQWLEFDRLSLEGS